MPDGQGGVETREFFVAAPNINIESNPVHGSNQLDGSAGFYQGGLNNQLILSDQNSISLSAWFDQVAALSDRSVFTDFSANQVGINDHASAATNEHPIQAQSDAMLEERKFMVFNKVDLGHTEEAIHGEYRSAIDGSPVHITNINVGTDLSSPGSNGSGSYVDVLQLQELSFLLFGLRPSGIGQIDNFVPLPVLEVAAGLGKDESQQNQSSLQHSLSFGSQTVPADRNLVNSFTALAPGAPSGASIDPSTGVLTWAVPRTQTVGLYTIAVTVMDAGTPALMGQ